MKERSPTFMLWELIMRYETLILIFVRAHRENNFSLYIVVLEELTALFFALDHVNYSRWMPVHIRDMKSLPNSIKVEFQERAHWVLSKTKNKFSSIPFDQAHEQENKIVKDSGGAVGLTENPAAFRRWMLSGPELGRLVTQFEGEYLTHEDTDNVMNFEHHEYGLSSQQHFQKQVSRLSETIKRMDNPFLDDFSDLVTLDNRSCTDDSVITTVRTLESIGKEQYHQYVKRVLDDRNHSIHDSIHRNSLPLFRKNHRKETSKHGKKSKFFRM